MKKLKRNAIQCRKCGDVIESKFTHDFKCCSCGSVGVDGGLEYARIIGDSENVIELHKCNTFYLGTKLILGRTCFCKLLSLNELNVCVFVSNCSPNALNITSVCTGDRLNDTVSSSK